MKSYYDKIILALGLIALIAGCAFYFLKSGEVTTDVDQLMSAQPTGAAYRPVTSPTVTVDVPVWHDPSAQDSAGLELYDIFTPPKIFWNPLEQRLTFEPPVAPPPPTPFGLALVNIDREMFRIQLEAYFDSPSGDPADTLIQFYNTRLNESVRGKVGEEFPEHGFRIVSFKVDRIIEETEDSTVIRRVPIAVIFDTQEDGRQIELTTESRLFIEGKIEITMRTQDPYAPEEFTWEQVGDTYRVDDALFTLQDFNFDNQTVRVEKQAPYLETPAIRTLDKRTPRPAASPAAGAPAPQQTQPQSEPAPFDSLFN